jgi:hypothetical protein
MFQTKVVEEIKKHIFCPITFFLKSAFYEIMWENIVELGRPQMTVKYSAFVLHAGYPRLQTDPRICDTSFARQQWLHKFASVLL